MADSKKSSKPKVKITVNRNWCKPCGICIAFCPTGVFVADSFGRPVVKHPEKCIKCMLCVIRCPDFAIEVEDE
jgi:2-oxoglutarate ferredoxin oxidoreductase subunit delta